MFGLGASELMLILVIVLFFMGPKKLPELAKGMGEAIREFHKSKNEMESKHEISVNPPVSEVSVKENKVS